MKEELKILLDRVASTVTLSESETDAMMREAFALAETPQEKREAGAYLRQVISRRKRPDVDVKGIFRRSLRIPEPFIYFKALFQ